MSLDTEINPATVAVPAARPIRLGLRQNAAQFTLLVAVNALVGGMLGQAHRSTVAGRIRVRAKAYPLLTFILAFGLAKAATNYLAGTWSDRYGRKPVLVAGWLVAVPVPVLLIWAPTWAWVVVANVLLGVSQADLVHHGDHEDRPGGTGSPGLAMGLSEAAGYSAVAAYLGHRFLADTYGLRPAPFLLCVAFAALGLGLSSLAVHETREHARLEAATHVAGPDGRFEYLADELSDRRVFSQTSFREPALSSATRRGWSTTSTTASRGVCFPCCSHPPDCRSRVSGYWLRSTRRCGDWVSW